MEILQEKLRFIYYVLREKALQQRVPGKAYATYNRKADNKDIARNGNVTPVYVTVADED